VGEKQIASKWNNRTIAQEAFQCFLSPFSFCSTTFHDPGAAQKKQRSDQKLTAEPTETLWWTLFICVRVCTRLLSLCDMMGQQTKGGGEELVPCGIDDGFLGVSSVCACILC
jgi:hypothetical protein